MRTCRPAALFALIALSPAAGLSQEPNFGRAIVATDAELFIGQPVNWYGPGVVYTYRPAANGAWREASRLTASDTSRKDDFGRAIATSGNTLVVGAPRKRDGAGVVYLFERRAATAPWQESRSLAAPAGGQFGVALAFSGDDLLVGAPGAAGTGVVHHLRQADGVWREHAVLQPTGGGDGSAFGATLSHEGDWLLIGAPGADSGAGAAFVSRRGSDGGWGVPQRLTLPRAAAPGGARVGTSVHLDGRRGFVGAPGAGVVHLIEREENDTWRATGELRPFDVSRGTQFGHAVAVVGDEVWVGAPTTNRGTGRVYRFLGDGSGGWLGAMRFEADSSDGASWPFAFGYAIAATPQGAVVGMPSRDFGEGRALVATRTPGGWQARQQLEGEIFAIGNTAESGARCTDGTIGAFTCANMELVSHLPVSALGGERGVWVNDVWGWTDPTTNRDYALVARRDGVSFVDLTDPAQPRLVGNLPRTVGSPPSVWRDVKVIGNHAFIVADGAGQHGMQIFDLTRLRGVASPRIFTPDTTYRGIASAHNVAADTSSGYVYIVSANSGGTTCGGGLHMVDVRDPRHPAFAGCYHSPSAGHGGGTHDAQCLVYRGPDARYRGREICVGSNESEINIADVTDKSAPKLIGRNSYPDVAYAHQGWFDDEHRYFYMNDELDELAGKVAGTRTIVWDLAELDDPVVASMYIAKVGSSDHNLFVKGDRVYAANYGSGLRVLDISDRANPREIAFFDSAPFNQDEPGHSATASGAWSNYPFFKSGIVVFTSVREGLFVVKVADLVP